MDILFLDTRYIRIVVAIYSLDYIILKKWNFSLFYRHKKKKTTQKTVYFNSPAIYKVVLITYMHPQNETTEKGIRQDTTL